MLETKTANAGFAGTTLTEREKACLVYGYARRMAEEAKAEGLFEDLSLDAVIHLFLHPEEL